VIVLPYRGEVWSVQLDPTLGHEQGGTRPCLVVSTNKFNHGPAGLVIVVPITSRDKRIPTHVRIPTGEAGLTADSYAKSEELRCVSKERFRKRWGSVAPGTMEAVAQRVRIILDL
jgi:mRNA interferase MazF